ncbi:MAG TPA: preprotein translocase subunit SecE [Magnetospirillaceae bacterium]|nr:preprotein translocase subunit SecE [Magnetospirillaceae bacterium]
MGEASKTKAKDVKKPSKVGGVLTKRIGAKTDTGLGRDVTAPTWLRAIGGYFKGSYDELRQVKWPNRRATWSLTFAVILFTFAFVALILGLDYAFDLLFKKVILS